MQLMREPLGYSAIVCIHACYEGAARFGEAAIERGNKTKFWLPNNPDAKIACSKIFQDLQQLVCRSVVNRHDFKIAECLRKDARDSIAEPSRPIADWKND